MFADSFLQILITGALVWTGAGFLVLVILLIGDTLGRRLW